MSSASDVAAGFSISGLLDAGAKTRSKYPVAELDIDAIEDNPANAVYSMEEAAIEALAESIEKDGLTDLPLVRKLTDGRWQLISGHRRRAAFRLLAAKNPTYRKMGCRIVEGITDEQAVSMLHAANYFVRELTVTERAAATRALGAQVQNMRDADPALSGVRTEDIKASIIEKQTGRKVSGKTIKRDESLAKTIEESVSDSWKPLANAGKISAAAVKELAAMPKQAQEKAFREMDVDGMSKRDITQSLLSIRPSESRPDDSLAKARKLVDKYAKDLKGTPAPHDAKCIKAIQAALRKLMDTSEASSTPEVASSLFRNTFSNACRNSTCPSRYATAEGALAPCRALARNRFIPAATSPQEGSMRGLPPLPGEQLLA